MWGLLIGFGSVGAVATAATLYPKTDGYPWDASVSARHLIAARNCAAARSIGLAPAYRGEPGYWRHNDADDDGNACEPWAPRKLHER